MPKPAFLTLQRRHGPGCSAGRKKGSFTFETDERRRNAKTCECRIYVCGTLGGIYKRMPTKERDWSRAREAAAAYAAAMTWDVASTIWDPEPPEPPPTHPICFNEPVEPAPPPGGLAIGEAVQRCLKDHETGGSSFNTIRKTRYVLGSLERFSADRGLRFIEEWTPPLVRELKAAWKVSPATAVKKLAIVKPFFELFVEDRVIPFNPARIRNRKNRALQASSPQKNPFMDAELERMLAACADVGRTEIREWPKKRDGRQVVAITEYRDYRRKWTGDDLALFMQISYFTGLRISDVATFRADRLQANGEVRLRCTKNGSWVAVPIPEWLQSEIRRRAQTRGGPLIFGKHSTTNINAITDVWRRRLNKLWKRCGPWDDKPTHHRFRHTFIRILLERRVPLSDIAELTGDTEQMIRRHYSAWIPGRQESLSRSLGQAFAGVPRYHG